MISQREKSDSFAFGIFSNGLNINYFKGFLCFLGGVNVLTNEVP